MDALPGLAGPECSPFGKNDTRQVAETHRSSRALFRFSFVFSSIDYIDYYVVLGDLAA